MFNFSEEVMIILKKGEEEAISVSSELLSSEHILLAILNTTNFIKESLLDRFSTALKSAVTLKNKKKDSTARTRPTRPRPASHCG